MISYSSILNATRQGYGLRRIFNDRLRFEVCEVVPITAGGVSDLFCVKTTCYMLNHTVNFRNAAV